MDGDKPKRQKFKRYPIGYFHIDIAEVRTEEGKLHLFVAIDRTSKFAVATCPADFNGESEAVFVLDFLNGTLTGGVINNQTGKYQHRYYRQLAADFKVDPNTPEPEYAIVCTRGNLRGNGVSKGIIHIVEKSSGAMIAYGFNFPTRANPNTPLPVTVLDFVQFRESTN